MSELFGNSSQDGRDQAELFYEEMIEPQYLEARNMLRSYQQELDAVTPDEGEREEVLEELHERLDELDVFRKEVKLSAKVRPLAEEFADELECLLDEGDIETLIDSDEYGSFIHVVGATGFRLSGAEFSHANCGERIGFIVTDLYDNEYHILPEDIHQLEEADQSDSSVVKEVEAFYPSVASQIQEVHDYQDPNELVDYLSYMQLTLSDKELRAPASRVARQLGRYASMAAYLDTVSHEIAFSGDFSILDRYGDFQSRHTEQDVSVVGDLRTITMGHTVKDGTHVFTPELDVTVGLPGKDNGHTALRIPTKNISSIASQRLPDIDFILGSDIGNIEQPVAPDESDLTYIDMTTADYASEAIEPKLVSEEEYDSYRRRFEGARIQLEKIQADMDDVIGELSELSKQQFSVHRPEGWQAKVKEIAEMFRELNQGLSEQPWAYTGAGVVSEGGVRVFGHQPALDSVAGVLGALRFCVVPSGGDESSGPEFLSLDSYLSLTHPVSDTQEETLFYTPSESLSIPLKVEGNFVRDITVLHVPSLESPPKLTSLSVIEGRNDVIAASREMFGEDSDLHKILDTFIEGSNLSMVAGEEYCYPLPLSEMQQILSTHPRAAECTKLMTESLGRGVMQKIYVSVRLPSDDNEVQTEYYGSAMLTGIEHIEGDEGPVVHMQIDEVTHSVPLANMQELHIAG